MTRKVEIVPYRSDWPVQFEVEEAALLDIFGKQVVTIHHFGSTSIPGISAKPIIDILLTLLDIDIADKMTPQLHRIGYHAVGEYGIPGRRFFFKGSDDIRSHHLHIYQYDNPHVLRHIAFRDYMRTHRLPARAYARLKEELARQFPENMEDYVAGKNAFVKEHERRALEWWNKRQQENYRLIQRPVERERRVDQGFHGVRKPGLDLLLHGTPKIKK